MKVMLTELFSNGQQVCGEQCIAQQLSDGCHVTAPTLRVMVMLVHSLTMVLNFLQ